MRGEAGALHSPKHIHTQNSQNIGMATSKIVTTKSPIFLEIREYFRNLKCRGGNKVAVTVAVEVEVGVLSRRAGMGFNRTLLYNHG